MTEAKFSALLERAFHFQQAVQEHVAAMSPVPEARYVVAFQSNLLSLEHGFSARHVLLYVASTMDVDKLTKPLTSESA